MIWSRQCNTHIPCWTKCLNQISWFLISMARVYARSTNPLGSFTLFVEILEGELLLSLRSSKGAGGRYRQSMQIRDAYRIWRCGKQKWGWWWWLQTLVILIVWPKKKNLLVTLQRISCILNSDFLEPDTIIAISSFEFLITQKMVNQNSVRKLYWDIIRGSLPKLWFRAHNLKATYLIWVLNYPLQTRFLHDVTKQLKTIYDQAHVKCCLGMSQAQNFLKIHLSKLNLSRKNKEHQENLTYIIDNLHILLSIDLRRSSKSQLLNCPPLNFYFSSGNHWHNVSNNNITIETASFLGKFR